LALAYILFKLIAAVIALVLFPVTIPLLIRASKTIDGVTLLAGYHTAYNIVGVAVLLPLVDRFTRVVERILPERRSPLTRCLDQAALVMPLAAEEAVRRTVARSLGTMCGSIAEAVTTVRGALAVTEPSDALRQAREFISEANGPPESEEEQDRLTSTLFALDYASRLAEVAANAGELTSATGSSVDARAAELCTDAMRNAGVIAGEVGALPDAAEQAVAHEPISDRKIIQLEHCAKALRELQPVHRAEILRSVAAGALNAAEALARVDTIRRLEALTYHAWRSAAHLVDCRPSFSATSDRLRYDIAQSHHDMS
jgi:phosphate:Na+ symporter